MIIIFLLGHGDTCRLLNNLFWCFKYFKISPPKVLQNQVSSNKVQKRCTPSNACSNIT